jgi:hypothetical protein
VFLLFTQASSCRVVVEISLNLNLTMSKRKIKEEEQSLEGVTELLTNEMLRGVIQNLEQDKARILLEFNELKEKLIDIFK